MNSDLSGGPMEVENNTEGGPAPVSDGDNIETPQGIENLSRTPSTCYPQPSLTPEDLLPAQEGKAIQEFNIAQPIGEGILADVNLLDAGSHIGINTVGQSLRNANLQLRSEPPNPQTEISPWLNSTIAPDLQRKPLELTDSCAKSQGITPTDIPGRDINNGTDLNSDSSLTGNNNDNHPLPSNSI